MNRLKSLAIFVLEMALALAAIPFVPGGNQEIPRVFPGSPIMPWMF
jgi:hypothetical protein